MTRQRGHGVTVETDSILAALAPTRALRQALDVLWGNLPADAETPIIREAFHAIDKHIREAELGDLRRGVLARDYFIISPINPMNPPSSENMDKVAAAIRILDALGLVVTL